MSFQVCQNTILWRNNLQKQSTTRLKNCVYYSKYHYLLTKKDCSPFLSLMNYLGKFLAATAEVCEPCRKLVPLKSEWTWNRTYQNLYAREKAAMKIAATMVFCNDKEQLYLETDVLGVGLKTSLLQVRDGRQFPGDKASDNSASDQ